MMSLSRCRRYVKVTGEHEKYYCAVLKDAATMRISRKRLRTASNAVEYRRRFLAKLESLQACVVEVNR